MDFSKLIKKRQSIRSFKPKEINKDSIKQIIEAAIRAPSAGNMQSYEIFLVEDTSVKEGLSRASLDQDSIREAPVCLVFTANPMRNAEKYGERGRTLYSIQDATIATAYAQLEVDNLGYGCVWVGAFEPEKVREVLDIDESLIPVSILPIGIPNEKPEYKSRRDYQNIVREIKKETT